MRRQVKYLNSFLLFVWMAHPATGQTTDVMDVLQANRAVERLEHACIEGRGFGTDLLSVSDRIARCTELSGTPGGAFIGMFHRARARMSEKDWHGAVRDFSEALVIDPTAAEAMFERGRVQFLYLEQAGEALDDFSRASELAPERPGYRMMLALAAIELAKQSEGDSVSQLVETARLGLQSYLDLTENTDDPNEHIQRMAAQDVLKRLAKN